MDNVLPDWIPEGAQEEIGEFYRGIRNVWEGRAWKSGKKVHSGKMYNDSGEVMDENKVLWRGADEREQFGSDKWGTEDSPGRYPGVGNAYHGMFMDSPWSDRVRDTQDQNIYDPEGEEQSYSLRNLPQNNSY